MRRETMPSPNKQTFGETTVGAAQPNSFLTEKAAAQKFSLAVVRFSRNDLGTASNRTNEAAKHWKDGSRFPNGSSLINLARHNSRIREWLYDQIENFDAGPKHDASALNTVIVGLQMAANMPGQQGAMARALLKKMQEGG